MKTACSFLQKLVSVGLEDSKVGEMTVLGHVKHKLICCPNFKSSWSQTPIKVIDEGW